MTTTTKGLCRTSCCSTCPMLGGFALRKARRQEIYRAVMLKGDRFSCHSEVDYRDGDDGETYADDYAARQCAGATTLTMRDGGANQVMRWQERLGGRLVEDKRVPFAGWVAWVNEDDAVDDDSHHPPPTLVTCDVVESGCEYPAGWAGSGGVVRNLDGMSDPDWCSACGDAMCESCTSDYTDEGALLCAPCGEELLGIESED